jgi:hypothetical protein
MPYPAPASRGTIAASRHQVDMKLRHRVADRRNVELVAGRYRFQRPRMRAISLMSCR